MVDPGAAGKRDDARRMTEMMEPARNLLLLRTEALWREDLVRFGGGVDAQRVQKVRHRRVPLAAFVAIGEMLATGE